MDKNVVRKEVRDGNQDRINTLTKVKQKWKNKTKPYIQYKNKFPTSTPHATIRDNSDHPKHRVMSRSPYNSVPVQKTDHT